MDKVTKFLIATALAGLSAVAVAQNQGAVTPAEQRLLSKGVKVTQSFPSVSGLRAIIADSGTEKRLFSITPEGQSLIVAMVLEQ